MVLIRWIKSIVRTVFPFIPRMKNVSVKMMEYYRFCKNNNRYIYFFNEAPRIEEVVLGDSAGDNPFCTTEYVPNNTSGIKLTDGYKVREVLDLIKDYKFDGTIIDIGCAQGAWTYRLNEITGRDVIGIDVNPEGIESLNRKNNNQSVSFMDGKIQDMPVADSAASLVFANGIIQYVERLEDALNELHRVSNNMVVVARVCLFKHHATTKVYQDGRFPVWIRNYDELVTALSLKFEIVHVDYSATVMYVENISEPVIVFHFVLRNRKNVR